MFEKHYRLMTSSWYHNFLLSYIRYSVALTVPPQYMSTKDNSTFCNIFKLFPTTIHFNCPWKVYDVIIFIRFSIYRISFCSILVSRVLSAFYFTLPDLLFYMIIVLCPNLSICIPCISESATYLDQLNREKFCDEEIALNASLP